MAITQTIATRSSRRVRGEEQGLTAVDPPSSSINGDDNNNQPTPGDGNDQLNDALNGTDDPADEGGDEVRDSIDGEVMEEERRDEVARSMDDYHVGNTDESAEGIARGRAVDNKAEDSEQSDSDSPTTSISEPSSNGSTDGDSSSDSSESTSDSSSDSDSSDSDDSSSDDESSKANRKRKASASLKRAVKLALLKRDRKTACAVAGSSNKKGKKSVAKHGKEKSLKTRSSLGVKGLVTKQNGIKFQAGLPCKSLLPALQPYWGDAMKNLSEKVPLTVLNPMFVQKDREESQNNNSASSSSKSSKNRGLNPPSEFAMSFGEWIDGISLLRKYLKHSYGFKLLAEQLKSHVRRVKEIKSSTESWMVALRYDIMFRAQLFSHRAKGVPVPDASLYIEKFEKQAKDKASRLGEMSFGDTNLYAKGGRFENRDPILGTWNEQSGSSGRKRMGVAAPAQRRVQRPPRQPRLPDIIDMLPPRVARTNEEGSGALRGANRRGRGGAMNLRGRARQQ